MALKVYNTWSNKKEVFKSKKKGEVRIYHCGPTVYSYAHIGNFRAYVFADLLRRYLEWKGYQVKQIMNITDVGHMTMDDVADSKGEDKIEKAAKLQGKTPEEIADHYTMAFFEDIGKLNLRKAYFYPKATDHIGEMQEIISRLIKKGYAYVRKGGVYFEVSKFEKYGKLSGNTLKKLQAGKRVGIISEKKSPFDFALWIRNPRHVMQWPSQWGSGYPGWHIECSAMSLEYLGEGFDIHTGGEDNIFPHHECEIAQAVGSGRKFARYWMHTRHLLVDGKKMSKSLGNFYTLRDLLKKRWSPREIRMLLISANYRTKLNFTEKGLQSARDTLAGLDVLVSRLRGVRKGKDLKKVRSLLDTTLWNIEKALDDDLNISKALSHLFDLLREVNKLLDKGWMSKGNANNVLKFLFDIDTVLGLDLEKQEGFLREVPEKVRRLVGEREGFRKKQNWDEADRIRIILRNMGYSVEDTPSGPKIKKTG